LPTPLAAELTVIQELLLVAVQPQDWELAVREVLADPPLADKDALVGLRLTVHWTPDWSAVNVWPATMIVPVRDAPELAAAFAPPVRWTTCEKTG
jgi:hypothetical protein